jgi:hypothetical protein
MRIAGGIIAIFLALIVLVQSLAAGTANALGESMEQSHDAGGSWGFLVALLFVVGGSLLIGKVRKGSLGVFAAAGLIGVLAGATTIFGDLIVWGVVAFVYAAAIAFGLYRGRKPTAVEPVSATN